MDGYGWMEHANETARAWTALILFLAWMETVPWWSERRDDEVMLGSYARPSQGGGISSSAWVGWAVEMGTQQGLEN